MNGGVVCVGEVVRYRTKVFKKPAVAPGSRSDKQSRLDEKQRPLCEKKYRRKVMETAATTTTCEMDTTTPGQRKRKRGASTGRANIEDGGDAPQTKRKKGGRPPALTPLNPGDLHIDAGRTLYFEVESCAEGEEKHATGPDAAAVMRTGKLMLEGVLSCEVLGNRLTVANERRAPVVVPDFKLAVRAVFGLRVIREVDGMETEDHVVPIVPDAPSYKLPSDEDATEKGRVCCDWFAAETQTIFNDIRPVWRTLVKDVPPMVKKTAAAVREGQHARFIRAAGETGDKMAPRWAPILPYIIAKRASRRTPRERVRRRRRGGGDEEGRRRQTNHRGEGRRSARSYRRLFRRLQDARVQTRTHPRSVGDRARRSGPLPPSSS